MVTMKPYALTVVFSAVLIGLVAGTLFMPAATATIVADAVKFEPKRMDLANPEEIVTVTIRFERAPEIDTSTVLLEGTVPAMPDSNSTGTKPPEYLCNFDGYAVRDVMWTIIYHMGKINPQGIYLVHLTVTGNLYDGTPFMGTGNIQARPTGHSPPPPPPP